MVVELICLKLMSWRMLGPSQFREGVEVGRMHQIFGCLRRFGWTGWIFAGWVDISQVEGLGLGGWHHIFAYGIIVIMIKIASPNQVKIHPINVVQLKQISY